MRYFSEKTIFNLKTVAGLIAVFVLVSIFVPFTGISASSPSLSISKSVDKRFALPNEEIVYTLNYQNSGPGTATGVVIKDSFTDQNQHYLTFISATPTPDSGSDTWIIDSLSPAQTGQITIRAKISSAIYLGSLEIKNRASIDSNETTLRYSNYASTFVSVRPAINITKSIRNITTSSSFSQVVKAEPGNKVEFLIEINSFANGKADNVKVWDELPDRLNYISGSTKIDDVSHIDGITEGGINIGSIAAGQKKNVRFQAELSSGSNFNPGTTILNNYGYAEADSIYVIYDSAAVFVEKEIQGGNNVSLISTSSTSSTLSVSKLVRNITKSSTYWQSWLDVIYAEPGDELEFLIKISSGTKKIDSVRVEDKLPPRLTYIPDSTAVDGYYEPNDITSKNIYIGTVYPYLTREIKFKAKIASASQFSLYPINLVNIAYAWGSDGTKIKDSAEIIVREPTSGSVKGVSVSLTDHLSISKSGHNISQKQTNWLDSFSAKPDEEAEFLIQITNTSNADLTNVKVWDILPANLLIIKDSTTIDGVSWGGDVVEGGLDLGTLRVNRVRTIKFKAKIASANKFSVGSTALINTAYVKADNVSQVSDQASVNVEKSGEVKGAAYVPTGANLIGLIILAIISCLFALLIYCRLRENKLLEVQANGKSNKISKCLARFYFRLKFAFKLKSARFKKVYW